MNSLIANAGEFYGAGDGTRTRDIQLGKLTFYQLNYTRKNFVSASLGEIFVRGET